MLLVAFTASCLGSLCLGDGMCSDPKAIIFFFDRGYWPPYPSSEGPYPAERRHDAGPAE